MFYNIAALDFNYELLVFYKYTKAAIYLMQGHKNELVRRQKKIFSRERSTGIRNNSRLKSK